MFEFSKFHSFGRFIGPAHPVSSDGPYVLTICFQERFFTHILWQFLIPIDPVCESSPLSKICILFCCYEFALQFFLFQYWRSLYFSAGDKKWSKIAQYVLVDVFNVERQSADMTTCQEKQNTCQGKLVRRGLFTMSSYLKWHYNLRDRGKNVISDGSSAHVAEMASSWQVDDDVDRLRLSLPFIRSRLHRPPFTFTCKWPTDGGGSRKWISRRLLESCDSSSIPSGLLCPSWIRLTWRHFVARNGRRLARSLESRVSIRRYARVEKDSSTSASEQNSRNGFHY